MKQPILLLWTNSSDFIFPIARGQSRRRIDRAFWFVLCPACFWLLMSCPEVAAQPNQTVAVIVTVEGRVEFLSRHGNTVDSVCPQQNSLPNGWQTLCSKQRLLAGDIIRTGDDGEARVRMQDGMTMVLNRNTRFVLKQVARRAGWLQVKLQHMQKSLYHLSGWIPGKSAEALILNYGQDADIDIVTPTMTAGIHGTEFTIKVASDDTTTVNVLEGTVYATNSENPQDTQIAGQGFDIVAKKGKPLIKRERITIANKDLVQWSLFVPPLFDKHEISEAKGNPELTLALQQAYHELMTGKVAEAIEELHAICQHYPQHSAPWRLLALGFLVVNQREQAVEAAKRSVEVAPESAAALVMLSYTYQGIFDLSAARKTVHAALEIEHHNALALIALARLQFGMGQVDEALQTIAKAEGLGLNDAEIYNLRGFILLAQRETANAIENFQRAIELNSDLGEPHLGLALAAMRLNDTASAQKSIATAVLLEPGRSIFRSYWAKMLYQIKRFDQALAMLQLAKKYDLQDPTPFLYEAIIFRDWNRPTEAIRSLQNAISLNDKRAIYRSRFLLDQDLAVKNADLSQIFQQLDLDAWAKNKAFASVKEDYSNYSGHVMLAGALRQEEGRAFSQASEALLSRLLQPGNINSFNTYNEYTSLFEKPAVKGSVTGVGGTDGVGQGELIAYGAVPDANLAFQGAGTYSTSDGWRDTNGDERWNIGLIAKWDFLPRNGLLFTASHATLKFDDEFYPRFEFDSPSQPDDSTRTRLNRYELGYHYNLRPESDLLLFFSRVDLKTDLSTVRREDLPPLQPRPDLDSIFETSQDIAARSTIYQAQIQYTFSYKDKWFGKHQFILGSAQYWTENDQNSTQEQVITQGGIPAFSAQPVLSHFSIDKRLHSYYVQDTWKLSRSWTVDAAVYVDHFKDGDPAQGTQWTLTEVNPRLGVIWKPTVSDTFRLAAFRYLVPLSIARLDPTDIAGVTIVRDNREGMLAKEADLSWERQWDSGFLSTNFFYLEQKYSHKNRGDSDLQKDRARIKGVELTWNQLIWQGFGLVGNYRYLNVEDEAFNGETDREDHLARVGLNYLNSNGFSVGVSETYRSISSVDGGRPDENIWISDLHVGYELPGKFGTLNVFVRNLFDQRFNWVTDQFVFQGRVPSREILGTISINFDL